MQYQHLTFVGLAAGEQYIVQLFWEPECGLGVYFIRPADVIGYTVEAYRGAQLGEQRSDVYAHDTVRARDLQTARTRLRTQAADRRIREQLSRLILEAFTVDPGAPDGAALARLEQHLQAFRDRSHTATVSSTGGYFLTPRRNHYLNFSKLTPHQTYTLQPFWEPGLGLRLYVVHPGDVVGYTVEPYREGLQTAKRIRQVHAGLRVRAPDLETARKRFTWIEHRRGTKSLTLLLLRDPSMLDRLAWTPANPASKVAAQDTNRQVSERLETHGYTPTQIQTLSEISELVFGGLSLDEALAEVRVPDDQRTWYTTQWTEVLPQLLAPLREDGPTPQTGLEETGSAERGEQPSSDIGSLKKQLNDLILTALALDPVTPDPAALNRLRARLATFRQRPHAAVSTPGGYFLCTPVPHYTLTFEGLTPNQIYSVDPFWEHGLGLRLYFERPGDVIGYSAALYPNAQKNKRRGNVQAEVVVHAANLDAARAEPRDWLGHLIVQALQLDPETPDPVALRGLKSQLAAFRGRRFRVTPAAGLWQMTPVRNQGLQFLGLSPGQSYLLQPFWESRLGFRIYFVRLGDTRRYAVDPYRVALHGGTRAERRGITIAQLTTRAHDLEAARTNPKEWLGHLAIRAAALDPWDPNRPLLDRLQSSLEWFRSRRFVAAASGFGTYSITPSARQRLRFQKLAHRQSYVLQPYWEPGVGLRIYFVRNGEAMRYAIDAYQETQHQKDRREQRELTANLITRALNLETAREYPKELLERIVVRALALDPHGPHPHLYGQLDTWLKHFGRRRVAVTATPGGSYFLTPQPKRVLTFGTLATGRSYTILPRWEPGFGLRIYFVRLADVVGYTVDPYRDAGSQQDQEHVWARIRARAQDLATAHKRLLFLERHRGVISYALLTLRDPSAIDRLAWTPADPATKAAAHDLNRQVQQILQSHGYTPAQMQAFSEIGELVFGGLPLTEALTEAQIPPDEHAWYTTQWTEVLPQLLAPLREDGPTPQAGLEESNAAKAQLTHALQEEQLNALIREAIVLDPRAADPSALEQLEARLTAFRKARWAVTVGPTGIHTLLPVEHQPLHCALLSPNQTYVIHPVWEPGLGLRLYYVRPGEVIGYTLDAYRDALTRQARQDTYARVIARAKDLIRARTDLKDRFSALMVAALRLDPEHPDPAALQQVQTQIAALTAQYATVIASGGGWYTLTPVRNQYLSFTKLTPYQTYTIVPAWESGFGLRLYFVSPGETIGFTIDHYRDVQPSHRGHTTHAHITARVPTLAAARAHPELRIIPRRSVSFSIRADLKERLSAIIADALALDPQTPNPAGLTRLEAQLTQFREEEFTVTAGGDNGFVLTPFEHRRLHFYGLTGGQQYLLHPYWEPGIGLRLYFVRPGDVVGYTLDPYRGVQADGARRNIPAGVMVHADDLAVARASARPWVALKSAVHPSIRPDAERVDLKDRLAMLILTAMTINPSTHDAQMLAPLEVQLAQFREEHFAVAARDHGQYTITPMRYQRLNFYGLAAGEQYIVQPFWETGLGLWIYFARPGEVIGCTVEAYRGLQPGEERHGISAKIIVRADALETARTTLRAQIAAREAARAIREQLISLIVDALALDPNAPNQPIVDQLEKRLAEFRNSQRTVTASDGGFYMLTPVRNHRLAFSKLTPSQTYTLQPFWETGVGLQLHFVRPGGVIGYSLNAYRRRVQARVPGYTRLTPKVRAQDFETAQARLMTVDRVRRTPMRAIVLSAMLISEKFADLLKQNAAATDDTAENVAVREVHQRMMTALQTHGYTEAQIGHLVDVGGLVFCGLPLDEALTEAEIPAEQHAWYITQWTEVLPQLLAPLRDQDQPGQLTGLEELPAIAPTMDPALRQRQAQRTLGVEA